MLEDIECNDQIESTASKGVAQTRIGRKDVESCLDRSGLQPLVYFTPYPVPTSAAHPAGEGAVAIADLANSQPGRLPNAGGLELALEVQRLFMVDPSKVSGAPVLPHGIAVADRCVVAVMGFKREHTGVGYAKGIIHIRQYSATEPGGSRHATLS